MSLTSNTLTVSDISCSGILTHFPVVGGTNNIQLVGGKLSYSPQVADTNSKGTVQILASSSSSPGLNIINGQLSVTNTNFNGVFNPTRCATSEGCFTFNTKNTTSEAGSGTSSWGTWYDDRTYEHTIAYFKPSYKLTFGRGQPNGETPISMSGGWVSTGGQGWSNILPILNFTGDLPHLHNPINEALSDDRLKHNERILVNSLETINKLNIRQYDKGYEMKDYDYNGDISNTNRGIGVIAQEVETLNDEYLKYTVAKPMNEDGFYCMQPTSIFSIAIHAVQELSSLLKTEKNEIIDLEKELESQSILIDQLLDKVILLEQK